MMRVSVPEEGGRITLIAAGTQVRVRPPESDEVIFAGVVLSRKSGADRCLVLVTPDLHPAALEQLPPSPEDGPPSLSRLVAITSGKGGVGKTVLAVNLAVALAELGKKVCIVDGDLGTANVDILLNLMPKYNLPIGGRDHACRGGAGRRPRGTKCCRERGFAELTALGGTRSRSCWRAKPSGVMDFILLMGLGWEGG